MAPRARIRRPITRRRFLSLTGLAATGLVATACAGDAPLPGQTPQAPSGTAAPAGTGQPAAATQPVPGVPPTTPAAQRPTAAPAPTGYTEAPQLADQVKQGKLPPVAERLPKNPLVVQPLERVGKYGGTWRDALVGGADLAHLGLTIGYEHLVRWDLAWNQVLPNLAAAVEVNADGTAYTFRLREGHKWSDGQPFTADDILFWWEDVANDKELSPGGPGSLMEAGGKRGAVEKVDQHTVTFTFPNPHGLLLQLLSTAEGAGPTRYPKHYLRQFHKKYNPDGLDRLIKEHNAENWVKLFQLKGGNIPGTPYNAVWYNQELPTLHGWLLTTPYSGTGRVIAERNPFYFKVDPAGQQLPYIDRVTYDLLQDQEVMLLKTLSGELDLVLGKVTTLQNKAVLVDNRQRGQYRFVELITNLMNDVIIALNLNHKDPAKRQVFQNKDFRIGLSHAIDRQEIIDVVFVGQGEPWQAGPRKESQFFNERLAKQYTEYDVKRANEFLDRAFPRKDGSGIRLGPDGKPIAFVVEVAGSVRREWLDTLNLIAPMWRKVGVEAQIKNEDRALLYTRKGANEHDAVVWQGATGLRDALLDPRWYFPSSGESNYAEAWQTWYNNPSGAGARTAPEEPPGEIKRQMALYDQIKATTDEAKQAALFAQLLELAAEQFYAIGITLPPNDYGVVRNALRNVPATTPIGWLFQFPAVTTPAQYFFE